MPLRHPSAFRLLSMLRNQIVSALGRPLARCSGSPGLVGLSQVTWLYRLSPLRVGVFEAAVRPMRGGPGVRWDRVACGCRWWLAMRRWVCLLAGASHRVGKGDYRSARVLHGYRDRAHPRTRVAVTRITQCTSTQHQVTITRSMSVPSPSHPCTTSPSSLAPSTVPSCIQPLSTRTSRGRI